jgi:hypothetical protein
MNCKILNKAAQLAWTRVSERNKEVEVLVVEAYRESLVAAAGPEWKTDFLAGKWADGPPVKVVQMEDEIRDYLHSLGVQGSTIRRMLTAANRVVFFGIPYKYGRRVSLLDIGRIQAKLREEYPHGNVTEADWHAAIRDYVGAKEATAALESAGRRTGAQIVVPEAPPAATPADPLAEKAMLLDRLREVLAAAGDDVFRGRDQASVTLRQIRKQVESCRARLRKRIEFEDRTTARLEDGERTIRVAS